jgi:DNA-directed RNA polymerase sigma subunit (sigma70/sigma32)
MTLQEIGDKYGTTREAVRQMENRLLEKIRKSVRE